nr:hypothetical protein [Tanacetum cinerariifolium]
MRGEKEGGLGSYNQDFLLKTSNQQFEDLGNLTLMASMIFKNISTFSYGNEEIAPQLAKPDVNVEEKVAMVPPKVTLQLPKLKVKVEENIDMVPPKVTPQLRKHKVKVEEKIVKSEVFEDHIKETKTFKVINNMMTTFHLYCWEQRIKLAL